VRVFLHADALEVDEARAVDVQLEALAVLARLSRGASKRLDTPKDEDKTVLFGEPCGGLRQREESTGRREYRRTDDARGCSERMPGSAPGSCT
jgi:hypothetical protein